jgi:hypothetical protein
MIMGDFNDDPENDKGSRKVFPMVLLLPHRQKGHRGSLNHKFKWNLFGSDHG